MQLTEYFYYARKFGITICLSKWEHDYRITYARGVAICSLKDSFNKRIGRAIASGRAEKAYQKKSDIGVIKHLSGKIRPDARNYICNKFQKSKKGFFILNKHQLTEFERKLNDGPTKSRESRRSPSK